MTYLVINLEHDKVTVKVTVVVVKGITLVVEEGVQDEKITFLEVLEEVFRGNIVCI